MIIEKVVALILSPNLYLLIENMEHLIKLKNFPTRPFTFSDIGNWHFKQKTVRGFKTND